MQRHHLGLADRQRAGLVECHHADAMRHFQRLGVLDQDAGTRPRAGARHDRGGRGQPKRAWAGDHQHRHRVEQRRFPVPAQQAPAQHRQQRDDQHHRHEHRADLVHHALDRRLGRLRMLDHADDARQHGLGANGNGARHQQPFEVDRAAGQPVARLLGHRHALAGQHRFIRMAAAFDHLRIDRDALARTHHDLVADAHRRQRHAGFLAAAAHARGIGTQRRQRADGLGGLALGARLQPLAQPHQRDHHRRAFEVQVRHGLGGRAPHQPQRQAVRRGRTQRHQQVHVASARAHRLPASLVEAPAEHKLHRRRQQPLHPGRQHPVHAEPVQHHRRDQRQRQRGRDRHGPGAVPERRRARGLRRRRCAGFSTSRRRGPIARACHGGNQRGVIGGAAQHRDRGAFGGQVDLRLHHTRHRAQCLFHARHARRAGHVGDLQLDGVLRHRIAGIGHGACGGRQHGSGVGMQGGGLGGKVDGHVVYARHACQRVLHAPHARGAGHALDRQAPFRRVVKGLGGLRGEHSAGTCHGSGSSTVSMSASWTLPSWEGQVRNRMSLAPR
ncbi:hypothetical protein FQZ97_549500 [compost metagenome]